jgi:hypothetical protein
MLQGLEVETLERVALGIRAQQQTCTIIQRSRFRTAQRRLLVAAALVDEQHQLRHGPQPIEERIVDDELQKRAVVIDATAHFFVACPLGLQQAAMHDQQELAHALERLTFVAARQRHFQRHRGLLTHLVRKIARIGNVGAGDRRRRLVGHGQLDGDGVCGLCDYTES